MILKAQMNKLLLITLIIISLNCCNHGNLKLKHIETEPDDTKINAREIMLQEESEYNVTELYSFSEDLDITQVIGGDFTENSDTKKQLVAFIKNTLRYNGKPFYKQFSDSYYGVKYSFNTNGKYLFVTETEFGGGGSSFEIRKTFIFDTKLIKQISFDSIFINADVPNPSFHKFIIEYLLKNEWFNRPDLDPDYLPKAENSIAGYGFNLFYSKSGIGLKWDKGAIAPNSAGSIEIILPYSKAQEFLTQTGKEVFR